MTEEKIKAEIERLTTERDNVVVAANRQISYYNGGIEALSALLKADEPAEGGAESGTG